MASKIIILAAGQGTRMYSKLPKVLHPIAGKSLLSHIVGTVEKLEPEKVLLVHGYQGEQLQAAINPDHKVSWVYQKEQLGTAHAVEQALAEVSPEDQVLVLTGDVPLISQQTLLKLENVCQQGKFAIVTVNLADATGYGRIKRDIEGNIVAIVEHKDASKEELAISEINTGIMAMPGQFLLDALPKISNDNAQQEYYLTDIVGLAAASSMTIEAVEPENAIEVEGVNTKNQLANLERRYQTMIADDYLSQGMTIIDPKRVDFRGELEFGKDVVIDINVIFEGKNTLGDGCVIGANSILNNVTLEAGVEIKPMSILEDVTVKKGASIGPFARLRPGTEVGERAKIGNFVEVKNTKIGVSSKVSHLSYIGDAELGDEVNIGAGTITCNYDGANKHLTTIEDDVFVGSNTALVAPVTIEKGANIGAGSTITTKAPAGKLSLTRAKQIVIEKWKRPVKNKK